MPTRVASGTLVAQLQQFYTRWATTEARLSQALTSPNTLQAQEAQLLPHTRHLLASQLQLAVAQTIDVQLALEWILRTWEGEG